MSNTNYINSSFTPLLREFNNCDRCGDEWTSNVKLYSLNFFVYDDISFKNCSATSGDHSHRLWEIHLMRTGRQSYRINGERHALEAGEFLLISPGIAHCLTFDEGPFSKFSLLMGVPDRFVPLPKDTSQKSEVRYVKAKTTQAMIGILQYLFENVDPDERDALSNLHFCVAIFLQAVSKCLQKICDGSFTAETKKQINQNNNAAFCECVIAYIKEHISDILSAKRVANRFLISTRHLNRKLQDYYGKSYSAVVCKIRSDYAKDLLCFSDLSVEEIAVQVGYSNTSNFVRFFKRLEGQSPTKFRRMFHEMNRSYI